jgi:hypothetical protein
MGLVEGEQGSCQVGSQQLLRAQEKCGNDMAGCMVGLRQEFPLTSEDFQPSKQTSGYTVFSGHTALPLIQPRVVGRHPGMPQMGWPVLAAGGPQTMPANKNCSVNKN